MKLFKASLFVIMLGLLMYVTSCSQQLLEEKSEASDKVQVSETAATQALDARHAGMRQKSEIQAKMAVMPVGLANSIYPSPARQYSENYLSFQENRVMSVAEQSVSTFSIDVDTAAYSNIRRMLVREGRMPPAEAVKLEEMINYFSYEYDKPTSVEQPFSVQVEMATAPWNKNRQLLQIGLKGFEPALDKRPAANLVFLVDVSGSMHAADKLGLVKRALQMLVNQMNEQDRIALVVYAGAAGEVLASTSGDQKSKIMRAIESLDAGGSTNGGAGLELAYQIAEENRIEGGINRVLIASDGDMNVGITDLSDLKALIKQRRESGIALTTLGFGSGNYNYALMEQLADVGDGNAAYIDSLLEARKVLVEEMQGTLLTIAKDVKIQIEFNPNVVAEYRLLGYENRMLAREDFTNDKVDAGDIGAGHTVTALYEIALVDNTDLRISPKRYGDFGQKQQVTDAVFADEIAYVRLRYKRPVTQSGLASAPSIEISKPILRPLKYLTINEASANLRLASAVAGFGQLLRGGKYTGDWHYADAAQLIRSAKGQDTHGYRAELVSLVELASSLSPPKGS